MTITDEQIDEALLHFRSYCNGPGRIAFDSLTELRARRAADAKNPGQQSGQPVAESLAPAPSEPGDDGVAPIQAAALPDERKGERRDDSMRIPDNWGRRGIPIMRCRERRVTPGTRSDRKAGLITGMPQTVEYFRETMAMDCPIHGKEWCSCPVPKPEKVRPLPPDAFASDIERRNAADAEAWDARDRRKAGRAEIVHSRWSDPERRKAAPVTFDDIFISAPSWYGKRSTDFELKRPEAGNVCPQCEAEKEIAELKAAQPAGHQTPRILGYVNRPDCYGEEGSDRIVGVRVTEDAFPYMHAAINWIESCVKAKDELAAATSALAKASATHEWVPYASYIAENERARKAEAERDQQRHRAEAALASKAIVQATADRALSEAQQYLRERDEATALLRDARALIPHWTKTADNIDTWLSRQSPEGAA